MLVGQVGLVPMAVYAQEAASSEQQVEEQNNEGGLGEIIVTARKR